MHEYELPKHEPIQPRHYTMRMCDRRQSTNDSTQKVRRQNERRKVRRKREVA
jgi:hypothetical protein